MGRDTSKADEEYDLNALWQLFRLSTVLFVGVGWTVSSKLAVLMYRERPVDIESKPGPFNDVIPSLLSWIGNLGFGAAAFVGTWVVGIGLLRMHHKNHPVSAILEQRAP